ncbi:unnamed protein product, partial [Cyprideis torosa]
GVLAAAKRIKTDYRYRFHWIASDGWGQQIHLTHDLEEVALGAITLELASTPLKEFDQYMAGLTPETNLRNPW